VGAGRAVRRDHGRVDAAGRGGAWRERAARTSRRCCSSRRPGVARGSRRRAPGRGARGQGASASCAALRLEGRGCRARGRRAATRWPRTPTPRARAAAARRAAHAAAHPAQAETLAIVAYLQPVSRPRSRASAASPRVRDARRCSSAG
jgi:hypothetical protein